MKKQLLFGALVLVGIFSFINSFAQTTYTFTNCGATGGTGPTQGQVNTAYSSTNLNGNVTVNTQGIQEWVVPYTGNYSIYAAGAQGGDYGTTYIAGRGASIYGEFNLTAGTVLQIVVGQRGADYMTTGNAATGGGGGSYVVDTSNTTPLVIAGGGGGRRNTGAAGTFAQADGTISNNGQDAAATTGTGGSAGNGGTSSEPAGGGTGGPGAGLLSNGGACGSCSSNSYGKAFVNGALGGIIGLPYTSGTGTQGGFGGGGSGCWCYRGTPGGGGGYSGGGTGINNTAAGGGGSFNAGTNKMDTSGVHSGHGKVVITLLCPSIAPSISCSSNLILNSDSNNCGVMVNYAAPNDPCATVTQTSGLPSGSVFPIGTTTNTFIATNSFGSDTCSFTITVVDSIMPTVTCPSNVVTCNSVVNNIAPAYYDNCSVNVTYTLSGATTGSGNNDASGATFNVGVTTVQYMVSDSSGNMDSCSFTVTNNMVDTSVSRNLSTFTANETGATYQWLNCDSNFMAISGATNQSYTATTNGSYAVIVSKNGCTDTSACQMINNVGITNVGFGNISIYPNPTNGLFTIDMGSYDEVVNYTITSIDGRIVTQKSNVIENKITIDLGNESKGVYLLKLHNHKSSSVFRISRL